MTCILCMVFHGLEADNSDENTLMNLESVVLKGQEQWDVPGIAIGVIKDGRFLLARGFGYKGHQRKDAITANTLFSIGSCSKAFTAMSAAILVQQGKIKFDTPILNYLPDFRMVDAFRTQQASFRDFLSQKLGVAAYERLIDLNPGNREVLYKKLKDLQAVTGFREKYLYRNLMYAIAGHMVGKIAGTRWESFVQKEIFDPLGMSATNFDLDIAGSDDRASGYNHFDGKLVPVKYRDFVSSNPAGGINSNINDMLKWIRFMTDFSKKKGMETIIDVKLKRELQAPHMAVSSNPRSMIAPVENYAMGWNVQPYRGHHYLYHGGFVRGFSSLVSFMPQKKIGVVILCNHQVSLLIYYLNYYIYDRMLNNNETDWQALIEKNRPKYQKNNTTTPSKEIPVSAKLVRDLCAVYTNPVWGTVEILNKNARLFVRFNGNISLEASIQDSDRIRTEESREHDLFSEMIIELLRDQKKKVQKIRIQMDRDLDETEFVRQDLE